MNKIINKTFSVFNAQSFQNSITSSYANVYVMLGRTIPWANSSNSDILDDSFVPYPYDSVEYRNDIVKRGIILKKITGSDIQPVVPRNDWLAGEIYTAYDQTANLFLKVTETAIGNVNVNFILANTIFTTNIATLNLAFTTPNISEGDFIKLGEETKEIVFVNTVGDFIQVNSNFDLQYTEELLYKSEDSGYEYSNKFYVRNNLDQVFKCLFNNGGVPSTIKPEITLGGQLPENPFIETADGYKWKYLYTIPSGLKNRFFTERYMPVISDPVVVTNTRNGRVDIIQILDGGNGYFQGTTTNNYAIVKVSGDGTGAQFSVDVLNGKINEVNIINGGSGYTNMTLELQDPIKLPATSNASLRAVISPPGGHGSNPLLELGASEQMVSVDFRAELDNLYPTNTDGSTAFRQIALIRNPELISGENAFTSVYPMYTRLIVSSPSSTPFPVNSTLFVGENGDFSNAVFSATVVHFDAIENTVYIHDIQGNIEEIDGEEIYEKNNTTNYSQVFSIIAPDINILSGQLLYVENRAKITRNPNQTENVKLVVEF